MVGALGAAAWLALRARAGPDPALRVLPAPVSLPRGGNADALMRHVRALAADSMEGRLIGTAGNARARAYLERAFAEAGLEPLGVGAPRDARAAARPYAHPFVIRKLHIRPPLGPGRVTYHGANLVGLVRGTRLPARYIVVSAHYDHLGIRDGVVYNGADDNASGAAALLVLAGHFRRHPPAHSLLFVAFDGEERGRLGATAFLRAPPVPVASLALNVNLDMLGRNARGELFAAGTRYTPRLRPALDAVARRAPVRLRFGHDRMSWRLTDDWTDASDHGPFHDRGIPFVYFGVEDHPDYHQPTDDVEWLMPAFYAGAVATVRDAVTALDAVLAAPGGAGVPATGGR